MPLDVRGAKFGAGESIVSKQSKEEADVKLGLCIKELQELVHAKKSESFSKYAGAL